MDVPGDSLPMSLSTRRLLGSDARALVTLAHEVEIEHFGIVAFLHDPEDVARRLSAGGGLGVVDGDRLVGAAEMGRGHHVTIRIAPVDATDRVVSTLVAWASATAATQHWPSITQVVPASDRRLRRLLGEDGYEVTDEHWVLQMDPATPLQRRKLQHGVTVTTYEPGDAHVVYELVEAAFAEYPSRTGVAFEDWRERHAAALHVGAPTWRLARLGSTIVGAAVVHKAGGVTWIDELAVDARWRGRGVAQELLATVLDAGRRTGCPVGRLETSLLMGARPFYERCGLHVIAELVVVERRL